MIELPESPVLIDEAGVRLRNNWMLNIFSTPLPHATRSVLTSTKLPEEKTGFDYHFGIEHVPALTHSFDLKSKECVQQLEKLAASNNYYLGEKIIELVKKEYQEALLG